MENNELCINAIKVISNEAINKANSGHPGMVLSSAAISYILFTKILNITSKEPTWQNRDRFVLGSGHASMLLYTNLHLLGYVISMNDIKNYRQLGSKCAGHPEYNAQEGVEATSGPLGQGIGHAVGMAMAEKHMASLFNKENFKIVDNYTYCLCGDGDIEEGASFESMSLAAQLKLNKLIVIYDCNDCTLDGPLSNSNIEDFKNRFKAMKWNVLEINGLDIVEVEKAIKKAKKSTEMPSIIIAHTIMGVGATKEGTCDVHGSPLKDDIKVLKDRLNWHYEEFCIPEEVYQTYKDVDESNYKKYKNWVKLVKEYRLKYPKDFKDYEDAIKGDYSNVKFPEFEISDIEASRVSGQRVLNYIAPQIKNILGGASDVAKSVNTTLKGLGTFGKDKVGKNINYGIREFAMSLAQTGMLLYKGVRPYVGCFLVFSDYLKPSIRTAALMNVPSIYVLTHDSIAVGEDGPTHQPIEQVASLRLIPNTTVFRPCGSIETSLSYRYAFNNKQGPVVLCLSRQNMRNYARVDYNDFIKGGFVASKEHRRCDLTIIASGSEVNLALEIKEILRRKKDIRVVSIPSLELFRKQDKEYINKVLGTTRDKIIALEMGNGRLYYEFANKVIDIETFGASGKPSDVMNRFGFNTDAVIKSIL